MVSTAAELSFDSIKSAPSRLGIVVMTFLACYFALALLLYFFFLPVSVFQLLMGLMYTVSPEYFCPQRSIVTEVAPSPWCWCHTRTS
ncbi:hypothetical protein BDR04DRAFT_613912 [Suillus decipiens]|nr:hypothetical protein BDR04DRAFT_613912 [Suillus decipiens]